MEIDVDLAKCANPLTGLPGNIVIDQEVKESVESGKKCTIYYFDLDNFKAFNDVYGFENGDTMIKAMAKCMEESCKNGKFIGHVGGDDFYCFFPLSQCAYTETSAGTKQNLTRSLLKQPRTI